MTIETTSAAITALGLAAALAGCDFLQDHQLDRERSDAVYSEAMADYAAGRIDRAVSGLGRVVKSSPGNASARFQLACILQDVKKDHLGAICNYREFLLHDKSGDKAEFAKSRIAVCERLLAEELEKKYELGSAARIADENAELKKRVRELTKANAEFGKRLEKAAAKAAESAAETERMRKMLLADDDEDVSKPVIKTEAALLDDEPDESEDRIKISADAAKLKLEGDQERPATPFTDAAKLLIEDDSERETTPFAVAGKKQKREEKKPEDEPPHEEKPPFYIVQEGDTLYKLAVRFYGRRSAWTKIREANKTVISTDGRIRAGQKLVMP